MYNLFLCQYEFITFFFREPATKESQKCPHQNQEDQILSGTHLKAYPRTCTLTCWPVYFHLPTCTHRHTFMPLHPQIHAHTRAPILCPLREGSGGLYYPIKCLVKTNFWSQNFQTVLFVNHIHMWLWHIHIHMYIHLCFNIWGIYREIEFSFLD